MTASARWACSSARYVWTTVLLLVWRNRWRGDFGVGVLVGLLAGGLLMGVLSVAFGIVP
jgi:hypothetical protein